MRRSVFPWIIGAVVLVYLHGCSNAPDPPRAGDTVTPVLIRPTNFRPGEALDVAVQLQAKGKDGSPRHLGFAGIHKDPLASVVFYEGDSQLNSYEVRLSHRC